MRAMFIITYAIMGGILVPRAPSVANCVAASLPVTQPADPDPWALRLLNGVFFTDQGNLFLGKVQRLVHTRKEYSVGYNLNLIASYRPPLRARHSVIIFGRFAQAGNNEVTIPHFKEGDIILISATAIDAPGEFECAGAGVIPIGFDTAHVISVAEAPEIANALEELRKLVPLSGKGPPDGVAARKLLDSKSYPLFALGVSLLAAEGTKKDVHELEALLNGNGALPVQNGVWIAYALKYIAPAETSPSSEELLGILLEFGKSHSPPMNAAME